MTKSKDVDEFDSLAQSTSDLHKLKQTSTLKTNLIQANGSAESLMTTTNNAGTDSPGTVIREETRRRSSTNFNASKQLQLQRKSSLKSKFLSLFNIKESRDEFTDIKTVKRTERKELEREQSLIKRLREKKNEEHKEVFRPFEDMSLCRMASTAEADNPYVNLFDYGENSKKYLTEGEKKFQMANVATNMAMSGQDCG